MSSTSSIHPTLSPSRYHRSLSRHPIYRTALAALSAHISFIPIIADGSKSPAVPWKEFQQHLPSAHDARMWFSGTHGIAFITGRVSGNLEMLDFDAREAYAAFVERVEQEGYASLLDRVQQGYTEYSPKGVHLYYRCLDAIEGNQKLAQRPLDEPPYIESIIETRGEGGYSIAAPSGMGVHPSGLPYRIAAGALATIALLTSAERTLLLSVARSLDQMPVREKRHAPMYPQLSTERLPGHIFNERTSWSEVLEPHGWTYVGSQGTRDFWRRPGKDRGISATTNYQDSDLLYVFSTSTMLPSRTGLSKFAVYTFLVHNGDFSAAARDLAAHGYRDDMP